METHNRRFILYTAVENNQILFKIDHMKNNTLVSWVGVTDFKHAFEGGKGSPLCAVAKHLRPQRIILLWGDGKKTPMTRADDYRSWLLTQNGKDFPVPQIDVQKIPDSGGRVMDFAWVYEQIENALSQVATDETISVNASSGTSIMTAAWIVYAKAIGGADYDLYISSPEAGVQPLKLPPGLQIDLRKILAISDDDPLLGRYLRGELQGRSTEFAGLEGKSPALNLVKFRADGVAKYRVPVLITGAPGTGKSLLAQVIHRRSGVVGNFETVDCGQLYTETDIHSVFGWVKGAFTGAYQDNPGRIIKADDGTIFFDEIGNAPPFVQKTLLRFLQEGEYQRLNSPVSQKSNARVIAATNADLEKAVRDGGFRQDLLDRLRVVHIEIPSLKDRGEDIIPLAKQKLADFQKAQADVMRSLGNVEKRLSIAAEKVLYAYDWPGNVRELEHVIARLVIFSDPLMEEIDGSAVERQFSVSTKHGRDALLDRLLDSKFKLDSVLREVELHYVRRANEKAHGNKAEIARLLGYGDSRTPLHTMLKKFSEQGLPDPLQPFDRPPNR